MKISVNGRDMSVKARELDALLTEIGMGTERGGIAIAIDGAVVPRSDWMKTTIEEGAAIEIVGAAQGG